MTENRYNKLRCAGDLQALVDGHYREVKLGNSGKPLAWITSGAPVEILRAMDILPVYPENYGAICGARGTGTAMCQAMEDRGYSQDLCSYAKESLAGALDPEGAPIGGLPKPDLLITCSNICGTVLKWYEALARIYDAPLFVIDAPYVHEDDGKAPGHALHYVVDQLRDHIAWLEKHTGRKLDPERLRRAAALSDETTRLWREIRDLCKARPSPLNAPDLFTNMTPVVVLRGTTEARDFYRRLKAEVEERVAQGVGAIPHERYRLLWDNIAIWPVLFRFHSLFTERDACFVVDTYTGGWSMRMEGDDPLEALARAYVEVFLNQSVRFRADRMSEMIEHFGVDGFVMHSNRSCKPLSLGQYDIKRLVTERTGVPGLVIEADHCDARAYAEEPVRTRVQAFMETIQATQTTAAARAESVVSPR